MTNLNQSISLLVITDKSIGTDNRDFFSQSPVYSCSIEQFNSGEKKYTKYERSGGEDWTATTHADITTPWVILLEEDEFLTPKEEKKLLNYLDQERRTHAYVNVERFLPDDVIKKYAWVKTHKFFSDHSENLKKYFTAELRVIATSQLRKTGLFRTPDHGFEKMCSFHVDLTEQDNAFTNIRILRKSKTQPEKSKVPADHDVFKHGHQKYYDDSIYCYGFNWPHTIYSTLRFDHVPSIIEALREKLSTPEIVFYALKYLYNFREFVMASEVIKLIPEDWLERHPDLINIVGCIYFADGRHDEAIGIFSGAFKKFPYLDTIAKNTIKMHIITGQYDKIEALETEYQKTTGHPINDDFIQSFKAVHKGLAGKTTRISLCMIMKDEAKYLERALISVKEMVDEMIIVDTGSTDDSVSMAEKYGAKVFHLPWSDDFSAARNYAIEKATGDYIFMMDADEYISPFFFIESQMLVKLLSADSPCALKFFIGHYFNVSDWLFALRETSNFRTENTLIRLFPRIPGVQYKGLIEETIEEALAEQRIPVHLMAVETFHILHDSESRIERIKRKMHIYGKETAPNPVQILAATKDFSFIGDNEGTLHWLRQYQKLGIINDPKNLTLSLNIAKLLETMEREEAESLYDDILTRHPHDYRLLMNYASFLLKGNQIQKIQKLPFHLPNECAELKGKDRLDFACFTSLRFFELGDTEKAFATLGAILDEFTSSLFAQSLKFYYLIRMSHIEGAIRTLSDLFRILSIPKESKIESIEELLSVIENLCTTLLEGGYFNEEAIIIHGTLSLEKLWQAV